MQVEWNGKVIMRTSRAFNPAPISLGPGVPTIISGAELAPYLDSRNIDFVGYSREQYERTRALPEGSYRIIFTAYDYRRQDVRVSNAGSGFYYLTKNEPPLINMPVCGARVPVRSPQQVIFSWLPRNTASPNSAMQTRYEFSLYEVRPEGRNPNDVVLSSRPVFKTTIDYTQLVYGPAEPQLIENMRYAWQVRAIDTGGKDAFRNNGYSEVCTFSYSATDPAFNIGAVGGLRAEGESERRARIWWEKGGFDSYRIYYKKSGEGHEWFTSDILKEDLDATSTTGELKLYDLEPDTEYETRAQGKKMGTPGNYTEIIKFRTLPVRPAYCGDPALLPEGGPGEPFREAIKGMTIEVDGMEMTLLEVVHLGDGWYKGLGRVGVDYLGGAAFNVAFDRIFINQDREVVLGRIDFVTKGVAAIVEERLAGHPEREGNRNKNELAENNNDAEEKGVIFEGSIDSLFVGETGKIIIIGTEGERVVYEQPVDPVTGVASPVNIVDSKGNEYVVDKEGNVSQGTGNGEEIQETVTPGSATDSTVLYITYGKQKYQDKDVIFFPFDTKKKVTLKAVVENDTTQNKTFTWKGITSSKNHKGTIDLSKSTGKSANKVELTYGSKTIELSINVVGAYFERLPDGTSGQKNVYGYDEMDKANPDDDHVSVETNGETFVELHTSTKNFKGIFLTSDNEQIAEAVIDGNKVKIIGKGQNKKQTLINAYTVNDSSTAIATIAVNVYTKVTLSGDIYNVYLSGNSSTQVPGGISARTVKTEANKYLKYPVVELTNINTGVQVPVAYDLNGNGKLDYFKNSKQYELNIVYQALLNNRLKFNDIVRFKDAFTRNWEIMDSVKKGDTYILVKDHPSKPANKGFDLSKPYGEYTLQNPSGTQSETFQILSFKGDTVFITTSSNKSLVKGFSRDHPKTSSLATSHVIVSKAMTGGLSPYEGKVQDYTDDRPALICGNLTATSVGQRVAHELMHGQDLRDVNDNTNIMHFNTSLNIGDLPFRFKDLTPVVTGTSTPDSSKPKQNQWELIKGR